MPQNSRVFLLLRGKVYDILIYVLSYFLHMTSKIVKSTVRGQITLPSQWRANFATDNYLVEMHQDRLVIIPFNLEGSSNEEILFDADRDNDGKGVSPDHIIKMLKKIKHG